MSSAESRPQATEGELQILFVVTVACANPHKIVISTFLGGVRTSVMRWIQLEIRLISLLDLQSRQNYHSSKKHKTPIHKNNRYWDCFEIKYYWKLVTLFPFYSSPRWQEL